MSWKAKTKVRLNEYLQGDAFKDAEEEVEDDEEDDNLDDNEEEENLLDEQKEG